MSTPRRTFGASRVAFATCAVVGATAALACASSGGTGKAATNSGASTTTAARAASGENGRTDLGVVDLRPGTGARAMSGSCLYVHYVGSLPNGQTFETSRTTRANGKPADPIAFELGAGSVMPGWEKGLGGMQVGGLRQLWIPFRLAYGASGRPPAIPPRTDLVFDIELLGVAAALPTSSNAPRAESARTCPLWSAVNRSR